MEAISEKSSPEKQVRVRQISWTPLRWLLRLDDAIPARSEAEIEAEIERNYRWNFGVNLVDVAFFWLGLSFASSTTILPLFVSKLTSSPLPIGLLAVLSQAAWFLPQLLTAGMIERSARKKPWVVNLGFFSERLPVLLWPAAALLAIVSPPAALLAFFLVYAAHQVGAGLVAPAWQELIAGCFPVRTRGRFLGTSFFVGTAVGTVGALLSGRILQALPFPLNFAVLLGLAAVCITISWVFLALTREPVQPVEASSLQDHELKSKLGRILRRDDNFRHYLVARVCISLGAMGFGFVTVAAVQRFGVSDATVGYYTAVLMVGQAAGNLVCGPLADRYGHKLSLWLSTAALVAAFAVAWLAPGPTWFYAVFVLLGFYNSGVIISGLLIVMEFTNRNRRPTYVGIANTVVGSANLVAPLLGAQLASLGYGLLFLVSALISVVALVLITVLVQDPRHRPLPLEATIAAAPPEPETQAERMSQ